MVKQAQTVADIDGDLLWSRMLDMRDYGVRAINWTGGGEPTLHPDIDKLVARAHDLGIRQGAFTNGVSVRKRFKAPHLLDWIRISLTDRYMEALEFPLVRFYAENTTVGICMNLTEDNVGMVVDMCQQAKAIGAHYFQIRPALQRTYDKQPTFAIPYAELMAEATDSFKVYLSPYKFSDCHSPKPYDTCRAGLFVPVIDYFGNVRRCNYHLNDPTTVVGNLKDAPFSQIMAQMPEGVAVRSDCQTCCKNHEINKLLNGLLTVSDVNFI